MISERSSLSHAEKYNAVIKDSGAGVGCLASGRWRRILWVLWVARWSLHGCWIRCGGCRRVCYPVRGDHCHLVVPLPWGGVQWCLGGWCVPSGIHMNATSQGFPEHCIVTRWSVLFASLFSVLSVVSDQHQWPSELGLDLCWVNTELLYKLTERNRQKRSNYIILTCTHLFGPSHTSSTWQHRRSDQSPQFKESCHQFSIRSNVNYGHFLSYGV